MSARTDTSASVPSSGTVTLTRHQIASILVGKMGWEPVDVSAFWRLARKMQGGQP